MIKKLSGIVLIISSLFFFQKDLKASHIVGGQIRWECLSNGKYIFYMDIYQVCGVPNATTQTIRVLNSTFPNIIMNLDTNTFNAYNGGNLSPISTEGCQKVCGQLSYYSYQLLPFISDTVTLIGKPPLAGWVFYWEYCCRYHLDNLKNPNTQAIGLRAIMYPFKGKKANECYDSSPKFIEQANFTIPHSVDYYLNFAANDREGDSLVYSFDDPLNAGVSGSNYNPVSVIWENGYSKASPFPNSNQDSLNVAVQLDFQTGAVEGKVISPQRGQYTYSMRVDSYREGIKIASIWRDALIHTLERDSLNTGSYNTQSTIEFDGNNSYNYKISVEAGDSIRIPIKVFDPDLYFEDINDSTSLRASDLSLRFSSDRLSNDYTDESNCPLSSPCATLSPVPVLDNNGYYTIIDSGSVSTTFQWNTSCELLKTNDSLKPYVDSRRFNFSIKVVDDQCPPQATYAIMSIEIKRSIPNIVLSGRQLIVDNADSYMWFFNDTLIPNSDTNSISIQAPGTYSVQVYKNGCPSKVASIDLFTVGIYKEKVLEEVKVFPNPFKNNFILEIPHENIEDFQIKLRDISGKEQNVQLNSLNSYQYEIQNNYLLPGIYFLNVSFDGQSKNLKLIKF